MIDSMKNNQVAKLLAYVTGMVNQQVLLQLRRIVRVPARAPAVGPQGNFHTGDAAFKQATCQEASLAENGTAASEHTRATSDVPTTMINGSKRPK